MSDGTKDRVNDDMYWYNKHTGAVQEIEKLKKKIKRLQSKLKKDNK